MEREEQNQNSGGFLKYLIIILIILTVAFLSQQAYFQARGKTIISNAQNQAGAYLSKGYSWTANNIVPKVDGLAGQPQETQSGGEAVQNTINQSTQNSAQNISDEIKSIPEKISDYFSGIKDSIINPGTPQNCPGQSTQTSSDGQ